MRAEKEQETRPPGDLDSESAEGGSGDRLLRVGPGGLMGS
jgi:hypothetical protein